MIQDIFTNTKILFSLSISFLCLSLSLSRESFYNNIHLHRDLSLSLSFNSESEEEDSTCWRWTLITYLGYLWLITRQGEELSDLIQLLQTMNMNENEWNIIKVTLWILFISFSSSWIWRYSFFFPFLSLPFSLFHHSFLSFTGLSLITSLIIFWPRESLREEIKKREN